MVPKITLIMPAANAAPKLNLYDATTLESVTVLIKSLHPIDAVFKKIIANGKSTRILA
jgi:hypothetical protein